MGCECFDVVRFDLSTLQNFLSYSCHLQKCCFSSIPCCPFKVGTYCIFYWGFILYSLYLMYYYRAYSDSTCDSKFWH